jgi:hypothetical protein
MSKVVEPFPIFYDDVGTANLDPRENPVQLYWDEARTELANQPIRTLGGRPSYQGAPASVYLAEDAYSIAVFNSFGTPVTASDDTSPFITAEEAGNIAASPVRNETATSYTLTLSDQNAVLIITNASAITATIPANADVAFTVGCYVEVHQGGAGDITFAADAGVTLNVRGSFTKTAGQNAIAGLRKVAADTWALTGDLA